MKILWLANSLAACPGESSIYGGWLSGLDRALLERSDLVLVVAAPSVTRRTAVRVERRYYCHVGAGGGGALWNRMLFLLRGRARQQIYRELEDLILLEQPDVIHLHGTEDPILLDFIRTLKLPLVVSIQGSTRVVAHKYEDGIRCSFWDDLSWGWRCLLAGMAPGQKLAQYRSNGEVEVAALSSAMFVIGRTDWDRRFTQIMNPARTYFIGQELLRKPFYEIAWRGGRQFDNPCVVTTISANYYKGFDVILEAARLLAKTVRIEWHVCGLAPDSPLVRKVERSLGCSADSVGLVLLGDCPAERVADLLASADIYASASYVENSPNNVCEAQLVGVPCVATAAGGTLSIIEDKKTGLIVPPGDPWSLAGAILELLREPERAADYARLARVAALERHDESKAVQQYEAIYAVVAARTSSV